MRLGEVFSMFYFCVCVFEINYVSLICMFILSNKFLGKSAGIFVPAGTFSIPFSSPSETLITFYSLLLWLSYRLPIFCSFFLLLVICIIFEFQLTKFFLIMGHIFLCFYIL